MTQSGVAKNTFFLVTLYNFQKRGRAIANNDRIYGSNRGVGRKPPFFAFRLISARPAVS